MDTPIAPTGINRKPLSIIINIDKNTPFDVDGWAINKMSELPDEDSRIDVERGGFMYALVMSDPPHVEVWSVGPDGQLAELVKTVSI